MYTQPRLGKAAFSISMLAAIAFAAAVAGCGDSGGSGGTDNPTGGSVTISAPSIVTPNSTDPITDEKPTLTVTNVTVTGGGTATYTFQVASDQSFANIVAQQSGIGQGSGQTSWQVTVSLESGSYFWRARGDVGATTGPFSPVAQMVIVAVGGPGETLVVLDRLTDGSTLATDREGGTLTADGWRVNNNGDFLRYEIPTVVNGYAQWDNVGLTARGANDISLMLFGMWDPTAGRYTRNPFRVHVLKSFPDPHNPPYFRFRWISQGIEEEGFGNFTDWDPDTVYTFRVDWGPGEGANLARVFVNNQEFARVRYTRPYQPNTHYIELGIQERHESVIGAVYRNFVVVRRGE